VVISRMVARDGLSIQKFCNLFDLRILLTAKSYTVPKSANTLKNIVMEHGLKISNKIPEMILAEIKIGSR